MSYRTVEDGRASKPLLFFIIIYLFYFVESISLYVRSTCSLEDRLATIFGEPVSLPILIDHSTKLMIPIE